MKGFCDLHIHSHFSDGTLSPTQLMKLAEETGLGAIALCDHNTVKGLPEFVKAAKDSAVETVPGIEFSTEYEGKELHILGLFVGPEHYDAVNELLDAALRRKKQSNIALIEKLKAQGLPLDYWAIEAESAGNVNRAVIGAYMVRHGCCESMEDAFDKWLSLERGFFVPPKRPDSVEVIGFLKSIGAVAVLAHPFLNLDEAGLREFLPKAKGLDGMEVYYSLYDENQTRLAEGIAEEYGLIKSGGSDFHGANKPDIRLGKGKGTLAVPLSCLEELKERRRR